MKDQNFKLLRWLPIAASVALMILIAIVSIATVSELKKATYWREHTFQVILDAQRSTNGRDRVANKFTIVYCRKFRVRFGHRSRF